MTEKANGISNLEIYTQRMNASVLDKLFWADKIYEPLETIVDFGCADGALLDAYRRLFYDSENLPRFIAVDNNPQMLSIAKDKLGNDGVKCVESIEEVLERPSDCENGLLLLSSVLHEVFSYSDEKSFLESIFSGNFKYIAIRDMTYSYPTNMPQYIRPEYYELIKAYSPERLSSFEKVWGSARGYKQAHHHLLKYRYVENWDREVRENYLPLPYEELLSLIPDDYEVVYNELYVHPYVKHTVKRDMGITISMPTHVKLLLKRKD